MSPVSKTPELGLESTLRKLRLDKQALEARLEGEKNLKERENIQEEIKSVEEEIKRLESISPSKTPSMLLQGLENNIRELGLKIAGTSDIAERQELQKQKMACLDALAARQKTIKGLAEIEDATDTIKLDDKIIASLKTGDFDQADLNYLLKSDIRAFFDPKLESQLRVAEEQMKTNDKVRGALYPDINLVEQADSDWGKFNQDVEGEAAKLIAEKKDLENRLQTLEDETEKKSLTGRLGVINERLPYLSNEYHYRSKWTLNHYSELRKKRFSESLLANISPDILLKTRNLLEEARFMRVEKIREFLGEKFKKLQANFKKNKTEFSSSVIGETQEDFNVFQKCFIDKNPAFISQLIAKLKKNGKASIAPSIGVLQKILDNPSEAEGDPKIVKQILEDLESKEMRLESMANESKKFQKNRPKIEAEVLQGSKEVESLVEELKPYFPEGPSDRIKKRDEGRGFGPEEPFERLSAWLSENKGNLAKIGTLEAEELEMMRNDLETLRPHIGRCRNMMTANKAHRAIEAIENIRINPGELIPALVNTIGKEHVELVSSGDFQKYRAYTTTGFMVFYKKGKDWKIIIDKDAINKMGSAAATATQLDKIKKQITHELFHVEFEHNEKLRGELRKNFVDAKPNKWQEIKALFIQAFPNKKPPHGKWRDQDVLSEIFAMQNDLGFIHRPGNEPIDRLNNLILGMGLGAQLKADVDIGKYKKADEEAATILGAEEIEDMEAMVGGHEGKHAKGEKGEAVKGGGDYEENQIKLGDQEGWIERLQKSDYVSQVPGAKKFLNIIEDFMGDTINLNKRLEHPAKDEPVTLINKIIKDRLKMMDEDLKKIEKAIGDVMNESTNTLINPLRDLWNRTNFFSAEDIFQVCVDVYEFFARRHDRKKADHAARLGMAMFAGTDLAREAKARKLKAENTEVNEWKERYEHSDAWELLEAIDKLADSVDPSADQLKAILRILAQKGRIEWHREGLWRVLNKLQSSAQLVPGDPILHHNPSLLKQKLHNAMTAIWDKDEYLNLQRDNESGYESGIKKYQEPLNGIQDQLTYRLNQLLADYRHGKPVDPQEYEAIMVYAIEKGKSNCETVFFHLLCGQAYGLLQPDRGMTLDKFLNQWPATQWIYSKKPPRDQHDYLEVCKKYFKKDFEAGVCGADFKNFYWTVVENDMMTLQRVRKAVGLRNWDHDWARTITCLGDASTAEQYLSTKSGQKEAQDTGVENVTCGVLQWLEENAKHPERSDWRYGFTRQVAFMGVWDGILTGVAFTKQKYTTYNANMLQAVPREADIGNHPEWNVADHLVKIRKFLDALDPEFFQLIRETKAVSSEKTEDREAHLKKIKTCLGKYKNLAGTLEKLNEFDTVFKNMDEIVQGITASYTDAEFMNIIKSTLV